MSQNELTPSAPTTITDIDIPFGRLVMIILKVMLASIPALIIFYIIFFCIALVFMLILGGGAMFFHPQQWHFALPAPTP